MDKQERESQVVKERKATLPFVSFAFGIISLVVLFFGDDLMQLLSPFIYPFILISQVLIFIVLLVVSIVFIFTRFRSLSWKAFVPFVANVMTIVAVITLFYPLQYWRRDLEFLIKREKYEETIDWVQVNIVSGDIVVKENDYRLIVLPKEFENITPNSKILIENIDGDVCVEFSAIFAGMFEYEPRFWYCPPLEGYEIPNGASGFCEVLRVPDWYVCH